MTPPFTITYSPLTYCPPTTDSYILVIINESITSRETILSQILNCSPREAIIAHDTQGKPFLAHLPYHISISTSKNLTFLALSQFPIGIDTEYPRPIRSMNSIVHRLFHPEEIAFFEHNPTPETFRTLWTQKEAYAKYLGCGIDSSFPTWSVLSLPEALMTFPYHDFTISLCAPKAQNVTILSALQYFCWGNLVHF